MFLLYITFDGAEAVICRSYDWFITSGIILARAPVTVLRAAGITLEKFFVFGLVSSAQPASSTWTGAQSFGWVYHRFALEVTAVDRVVILQIIFRLCYRRKSGKAARSVMRETCLKTRWNVGCKIVSKTVHLWRLFHSEALLGGLVALEWVIWSPLPTCCFRAKRRTVTVCTCSGCLDWIIVFFKKDPVLNPAVGYLQYKMWSLF